RPITAVGTGAWSRGMSSLDEALRALGEAHGPSALARAFAAVQGQVRRARREAASRLGTLAKTYIAAMAIWDRQKADGVPLEARYEAMEQSIRLAWPRGREHAWHFLCASCSDYGLEMHQCPGDASCGRQRPHLAHDYGRPCWCQKGARFKDKPKPTGEDF